uniref:Uncharacterized protein n=1 Tax=Mycena chlorophos TaxID=658473 RepID=A0ABQ0M1U7_MYCCL|nr:predicted protein [Mycena chlorophos]
MTTEELVVIFVQHEPIPTRRVQQTREAMLGHVRRMAREKPRVVEELALSILSGAARAREDARMLLRGFEEYLESEE